jgi:hypothetical protein
MHFHSFDGAPARLSVIPGAMALPAFCIPSIVFAGLLLARLAHSQVVTATLTGTVTDTSGGTVPQASVTATELSTGAARSTLTGAVGVYTLPFLTPGNYRVDIEKAGFKKSSRENMALGVSTVG